MSRLSAWSSGLVLGLAVAVAVPLPLALAQAQPKPKPADQVPDGPTDPLDLVRGLREHGMSDLALEYLKELEGRPLPPAVKAVLVLERAKCQLEAADDEPDDATRSALVAEATIGFGDFLRTNAKHPRAAEAAIALARLKSLEAKAQLVKARRMEVPADKDDPNYEAAVKVQKEEAAKARPLFDEAAKLFQQGANRLAAQLKQPNLDANVRKALEQEQLEAELARGINTFALADTYLHATAAENKVRAGHLSEARKIFTDLTKRPNAGRAGWVARAWMAESEFEASNPKGGEAEFDAILKATALEAEDGKRMVRFFQLRRAYVEGVGERDMKKMQLAETQARNWLRQYGANRRARTEATATRYYLAFNLQRQAYILTPLPKDYPRTPYKPGGLAEGKLKEAERLYRVIIQSDNEYTDRAIRYRMLAVRQIIGEAEKPASEYKTFEDSQMAAIIQIAKLIDEEKQGADPDAVEAIRAKITALVGGGGEAFDWSAVIKARRLKIVALLERARALATEQDNPADVTDVLLQLIYFYEQTDQPHLAAVLGEDIARNRKTSGGKSSFAGAMSLNAYGMASASVPVEGGGADEIRKTDRARAIRLARYIDQKFPNDPATDRVRFRLGVLLFEEKDSLGAYEALIKVRPGFEGVVAARLYQGAIVTQLLTAKDSPLPENRRVEVFRRTVDDLEKLQPPLPAADGPVVRAYYSARVRLALLLFLQSRVDPEGEKAAPGFKRAQDIAEELIGRLDSFTAFVDDNEKEKEPAKEPPKGKGKEPPKPKGKGPKKLTLDGWEARLLAEDARARAAYLRANQIATQTNDPAALEEAFKVIGPLLAEMESQGPFATQVSAIAGAPAEGDPGADQGQRVAGLAAGVDRVRQELIVLALKTRVRQGNPEAAKPLIAMLKRFGGSIEKSVPVFEQLTREIAEQIKALRKQGNPQGATALANGFAGLLNIIAAEPDLSPAVVLFLGQALIVVENYPAAIDTLKKIPPPAQAAWLKLPADQFGMLDAKDQQATTQFKAASLYLIRAHRLAGQFDAADGMLKVIIGDQANPGWGYTSLIFRKEVAILWEARGAAEPALPKAKENYGNALKEWATLYQIARARVERDQKDPPKGADGTPDNFRMLQNKNAFYDAFFDYQRCIVIANTKLLAAVPEKLNASLDTVAKNFVEVEKAMGDDLDAAVWTRYADLLDETPPLKAAYQRQGGKKFLTRP
jgi:hypothetical protein